MPLPSWVREIRELDEQKAFDPEGERDFLAFESGERMLTLLHVGGISARAADTLFQSQIEVWTMLEHLDERFNRLEALLTEAVGAGAPEPAPEPQPAPAPTPAPEAKVTPPAEALEPAGHSVPVTGRLRDVEGRPAAPTVEELGAGSVD